MFVKLKKPLLLLLLTLSSLYKALAEQKCLENDEDCREKLMHRSLREQQIQRRSVKQEVFTEYWLDKGERFVAYKDATANRPLRNKAKNIILFLGDGMSLTTLAATRVYLGGEEQSLSFEDFTDTGLAKTYAFDHLVPDSAFGATAFLCGVKANYGIIGATGHVKRGNCKRAKNTKYHVDSIAKWALEDQDFYAEGKRHDGLDLIEHFLNENPFNKYVNNKEELLNMDLNTTQRLLALFNDGHLKYNLKALQTKKNKQPTLAEMTQKALELLHHSNKAMLALDKTVGLAKAVAVARTFSSVEDTLIVVTADHSHTISISGYAVSKTLSSANGPGFQSFYNSKNHYRGDPHEVLDAFEGDACDLQFPATVPLASETHGRGCASLYLRSLV